MGFEEIATSSGEGLDRSSDERFFLVQQEVLGRLFGDDEEGAATWILRNHGRNGALLREETERHIRVSEDNPDVLAEQIAKELRPLVKGDDFRKAA